MNNENSEILAELKKLNEYHTNSKKYGIALFLFVGFAIFFDVLTDYQLKNEKRKYYENNNKLIKSRKEESNPLWQEVQNKLNADDIDGLIKILNESVNKNPKNYYNQAELAMYYLRIHNLEKALEHYEKAYSLIPLERYEKIIIILKKQLENNS